MSGIFTNPIRTFVAVSICLASPGAFAASCVFGSLAGSTCTVAGDDFNVVYDLADVGLYGDARIVGSNVIFSPTGFGAASSDGAGAVAISGDMQFDLVMTSPLQALEQINLVERGRYQLNGAGSYVTHSGTVDVDDLTNFSQLAGTIDATGPMDIADNKSQVWTATGSIDFLSDPMHLADTLAARVTVGNVLTAFTQPGEVPSFASIEKTFDQQVVILGVNSTPPPLSGVPVPGAVWLFASGIGALGWLRRRSKR